ncbi:hypothetical protein MTBLM1_150002 [Rhodospirillaceae bacterium LM-1]|nr:hypothetical protein MTBLM1_150002 [Rhodospirillaceae bacterium LM-1]
MPKENRRILFTTAEVLRALMEYTALHNRPMGKGDVVSMLYDPKEDPALVLMVSGADGQIENHSFRLAELGAAIITFCRSHKVPLPHKGKKSLIKVDDAVAITVGHEWEIG